MKCHNALLLYFYNINTEFHWKPHQSIKYLLWISGLYMVFNWCFVFRFWGHCERCCTMACWFYSEKWGESNNPIQLLEIAYTHRKVNECARRHNCNKFYLPSSFAYSHELATNPRSPMLGLTFHRNVTVEKLKTYFRIVPILMMRQIIPNKSTT